MAANTDDGVVRGPLPGLRFAMGDVADDLPAVAADRLRGMRERADELSVLHRASFEAEQELRTEKQKIENLILNWKQSRSNGGHSMADDDPRVQGEQKKRDLKAAELKRRMQLEEVRGAQSQNLRRLIGNCERWLTSGRPGGTMIVEYTGKLPKAGADILGEIETCRRRGRELEAVRHSTESAPFPSASVKRKIRTEIDALAEVGKADVTGLIEHGGSDIRWAMEQRRVQIYNADPGAVGFLELANVPAITAWLFKAQLLQAIEAEVDAVADDAQALDDKTRAERLATVSRDLLHCERTEAALVWIAQSRGMAVAHREDIDPRALLGIDLAVVKSPPSGDRSHLTQFVGAPR